MREPDVLADIRAVRDELAARHGGDAWALSRALAERSQAAGRILVRFPPRVPSPPRAVGVQPPVALPLPLNSLAEAAADPEAHRKLQRINAKLTAQQPTGGAGVGALAGQRNIGPIAYRVHRMRWAGTCQSQSDNVLSLTYHAR